MIPQQGEQVEDWADFAETLSVVPAGTEELAPLVQTPGVEMTPVMAPGGRWLAYLSNSTGVTRSPRSREIGGSSPRDVTLA